MSVILLMLLAAAATWLGTSVRWRKRAAAQEAHWRRIEADLLAEMSSLRDETARARVRAGQITRDATGWAEGYKHGSNDMIRAMAALHGEVVTGQGVAEGKPDAR